MPLTIPAPVAVTDTAAPAGDLPPGPCTVILSNTGSTNVIYVGLTDNVTSDTGFPLPAGATVTFPLRTAAPGAQLYAVAAASGNSLGVLISS